MPRWRSMIKYQTAMASEFAARIRAKLSRRRDSFVSSLGSSRSTLSLNSQNQTVSTQQQQQQQQQHQHCEQSPLAPTNAGADKASAGSDGDDEEEEGEGEDGQVDGIKEAEVASSIEAGTSEANSTEAGTGWRAGKEQMRKSLSSSCARKKNMNMNKNMKKNTVIEGINSLKAVTTTTKKSTGTSTGTSTSTTDPPPHLEAPAPTTSTTTRATCGNTTTTTTTTDLQSSTLQPPSQPSIHHQQPISPASSSLNQLHIIEESSTPTSPSNATSENNHLGDKINNQEDDDNNNNNNSSENDDDEDGESCRPNAAASRDTNPDSLFINLASPLTAPPQTSAVTTPASFYFQPQPPPRRQSLFSQRQTNLIKTLLHGQPAANDANDTGSILPPIEFDPGMVTRKIWVKRPHASATLITINEEDLVDDVRDLILRKYANSLGKTFDSPDLTIRIVPREQQQKERLLGPEEPMCRTLDAYYPGGQIVAEALIIDIPVRRTPRPSPRAPATFYVTEDGRPSEAGEGYFPPVTVGGLPSPHHGVIQAPTNGAVSHSIAVLGTGHLPPIPSPGGTRRAYRERSDRPRLPGRTHTSSPTVIANSAHHTAASDPTSHDHQKGLHSGAPPMPTSPVSSTSQARAATPPPRVSSPRPSANRIKKPKKTTDYPSLPPGMLNGNVPPISVLIVEDNPINLKLLEAFVKRLKVRWQTAVNGREAVNRWRTGGFHLVLMDIQLPVMNGLDATKEIRRLERVNSIGVFSSSASSLPEQPNAGELQEQDRLDNMELFKSPVIIVALTASSLQSDRHDALAAGCNDFLTKPVNFVWLERKVMEWGCMQALIDFDGWRKWKDYSQEGAENESNKKHTAPKSKTRKNKSSLSSSTT